MNKVRPPGAQVMAARPADVTRLLADLTAQDLSTLDPTLGVWMDRPLGREMLARSILPAAGTVFVCLFNFEPAGLIVIERGRASAQVRALAVAPDMRRKGVAHTLLAEAIDRAGERKLEFLWMRAAAANESAITTALEMGFRRVLPQFLRRERTSPIPAPPEKARVTLEWVKAQTEERVFAWQEMESSAGDAWATDLIAGDLFAELALGHFAQGGRVFALAVDGAAVGGARLREQGGHAQINLWLAPEFWDTPEEIACLRAALDTLSQPPATLDVRPASSGHLRASVARYKELGFKPQLNDTLILARAV